MNTSPRVATAFWARIGFCAAWMSASIASAQIESAIWKSKTSGPAGQLAAFFPAPNTVSGSPHLLVVPLLGPQRRLLPDGRLLVWVGQSDGTALVNATVTLRVPENGNALVNGGVRVTEVTVQTNALGIAEARFTAPDVPPGSTDDGGGDGGDGGGGEGGGDPAPS